MKRPGKLVHECCPNAARHMVGNRRSTGYGWRVYGAPFGGASGDWVSVIYCPWCGVNLNEWAKLQQAPRKSLAVVR